MYDEEWCVNLQALNDAARESKRLDLFLVSKCKKPTPCPSPRSGP